MRRALIIYVATDNRNFIIRRSTKTKLCAAYVDDNCKWYVGAFMKSKLNGLWMVTSYLGPHTCIPFGLQRDGKMMDSNFVASEIVGRLRKNHTARTDELWEIIPTKYKHEVSNYKVWDVKKRQLLRYFEIERSLTKGCESCCWHTWIRIQVSSTTIIPYLGH